MSNVEFIARAKCQSCGAPVKLMIDTECADSASIDLLELLNRRCGKCGENVIQIATLEVENGNTEQQQ